MTGAGGSALEWAVALWRTPSLRHALRAQPLPTGMEGLLAIAAGAAGPLDDASRQLGQPRAQVLEQVRFALREQLFFPGADAYRTLGVGQDAAGETVRLHHRLLQQWLHPDRCTGDDAAFAGRVNAAWDTLRTQERRVAYEAALSAAREGAAGRNTVPGVVVWRQEPLSAHEVASARWRGRAPLLALLVACVGLGALALRDQGKAPARAAAVAIGLSDGDPLAGIALPQSTSPESPAAAAPSRPQRRSTPPAQVASQPRNMPPPPDPGTDTAKPPVPAPAAVAAASPAMPRTSFLDGQRSTAPPPTLSPVVAPPMPVTMGPTPPPSTAPSTVAMPTPPARASTAAPTPIPQPTAAPLAAAPPVSMASAPDPVRVRAAEQVGDRLLGYLARKGAGVPPIWNSPGAQQAAARMRTGLQDAEQVVLEAPQWRIAAESASMDAGVRYTDGSERRLHAQLVWREQRWLVANVAMERDQ